MLLKITNKTDYTHILFKKRQIIKLINSIILFNVVENKNKTDYTYMLLKKKTNKKVNKFNHSFQCC